MRSDTDLETQDIRIRIQRTLISINNITLKIKKELELIKELVNENGHLYTAVHAANETLFKKVQEMGMNVAEIISESEHNDRLQPYLLGSIISTMLTEKLEQINT